MKNTKTQNKNKISDYEELEEIKKELSYTEKINNFDGFIKYDKLDNLYLQFFSFDITSIFKRSFIIGNIIKELKEYNFNLLSIDFKDDFKISVTFKKEVLIK